MISGKVSDINKQTMYIAPKSKIESRAHYAPESARGNRRSINSMYLASGSSNAVSDHQYCSSLRTGLYVADFTSTTWPPRAY